MCVTHILGIIEGATQGVGQRVVEGFDKGIEEVDHENVEEDNEGDGEGNDGDDVYFVKVRYLSDGDDDDELQVGTENDVQEDAELEEEREKGMLFKDGKEFIDAIRKYSKLSRRELKINMNEPKRLRVKCIASAKCHWRIFASYSRATRCMQVKSSQEENNCCVSFQNKMVNVAAIADHFEATIRDHPKLKLKEIQRRVVSEMHVNVNITRCKRAKKRVNEKLFGNFKEEFAMLWDYADELRLKNPDLNDGFGFTIISDQQNATTKRGWEDKIEALTQKDELVAKDLKSKSPKHWTKAFFGCHSKCDMVNNNICEAFNSSILEARYKSIITMLEEIRVKLITRIVDKRKFCESWKHNYGHLVKKTFDQSKKDGIDWQMVWNDENGCEVKRGRKQYIMNILERICSCRSWQITGLPCPHACCAIWHMGGDPDDYLDQYYHKQTYMKAYAYALHSINGAHEWAKSEIEPVLPPIEKKKRCQEDQR
ncbi:hypothetical protein V6N13_014596 [Hibiscus sabdariffa]